jgi:unsaturated chondroitin disaccharide hydrolase
MRRIALLTAAILSVHCLKAQKDPALLSKILTQARVTVAEAHPVGKSPFSVDHGRQEWLLEGIAGWRSGFWPGTLWYLYEATGDGYWKEQADRSTRQLAAILDKQANSHDIGFQFYCSYGNAYRITKDEAYARVMLRAADSLATLFDPKYGTICSWAYRKRRGEWPHHTIIDNMMNLELLFWAARNGGGKRLYDIAVSHARVTHQAHYRPDNTTAHVALYDTVTGKPNRQMTHQGHADASMWARGQAWAIYGFTVCYRETKDAEFLQAATLAADVYLKRLPADKVPYWDFDDPGIPNVPRDASAASITASALLELSGLVKDKPTQARYRREALAMLDELSSSSYLKPEMNHAILQHSTGNKPQGKDIDVPLIYADYYFVEALRRAGRL